MLEQLARVTETLKERPTPNGPVPYLGKTAFLLGHTVNLGTDYPRPLAAVIDARTEVTQVFKIAQGNVLSAAGHLLHRELKRELDH